MLTNEKDREQDYARAKVIFPDFGDLGGTHVNISAWPRQIRAEQGQRRQVDGIPVQPRRAAGHAAGTSSTGRARPRAPDVLGLGTLKVDTAVADIAGRARRRQMVDRVGLNDGRAADAAMAATVAAELKQDGRAGQRRALCCW